MWLLQKSKHHGNILVIEKNYHDLIFSLLFFSFKMKLDYICYNLYFHLPTCFIYFYVNIYKSFLFLRAVYYSIICKKP